MRRDLGGGRGQAMWRLVFRNEDHGRDWIPQSQLSKSSVNVIGHPPPVHPDDRNIGTRGLGTSTLAIHTPGKAFFSQFS